MGPSVEEVLSICSNGSAPLNKMAAMPIYGKTKKTLKVFFSQTSFEAESWHWGLKVNQVCSNDDCTLTFDLQQGQIWVPLVLYEESVEKSFSQNVFKTNS